MYFAKTKRRQDLKQKKSGRRKRKRKKQGREWWQIGPISKTKKRKAYWVKGSNEKDVSE